MPCRVTWTCFPSEDKCKTGPGGKHIIGGLREVSYQRAQGLDGEVQKYAGNIFRFQHRMDLTHLRSDIHAKMHASSFWIYALCP